MSAEATINPSLHERMAQVEIHIQHIHKDNENIAKALRQLADNQTEQTKQMALLAHMQAEVMELRRDFQQHVEKSTDRNEQYIEDRAETRRRLSELEDFKVAARPTIDKSAKVWWLLAILGTGGGVATGYTLLQASGLVP